MMRDVILALALMLSLTALAACADEGFGMDQDMSGLAGDEAGYADHLSSSGIGSFFDNAMSRGIQDEYPFSPVDKTDSFSAMDGKAYSWLDLGQIDGPHQIEWRWHSPDGGLYFTDSSRVDGTDRGRKTAYSSIDIRGKKAASMPGSWRVDVYQDGRMMLNQRFTMAPEQNVQSSYPAGAPDGYQAVSSYYGDCSVRPPGTYCLVFSDYYTYLAQDAVTDGVWAEAGAWNGRTIEVIYGVKADYYHILHTPLLKIVPKSGYGYQGAPAPGPASAYASTADSTSAYTSTPDSNPGRGASCDCGAMGSAGKYDQAMECYNNALQAQPDTDNLWNGMGRMMNRMGRYQDANSCMDRALQMNPNNSDAWKNKGTAMMGMGRYDEAAGCFDKAASLR